MTTPNSSQQRPRWWVSQQTHRSDDGGQDGANEKCGQRWKKKKRIQFSLHTNDQQGCTIHGSLWKQCSALRAFLWSSVVTKEQKHTKELWESKWNLCEDFNTDLSWKYDREPSADVCVEAVFNLHVSRLSNNQNNLYWSLVCISYWGFKGVFHFIHWHTVFCAVDACVPVVWVHFVNCDWKTLTILKGLCNVCVWVMLCTTGILHTAPHTWGWKWLCTISCVIYPSIKLPVP